MGQTLTNGIYLPAEGEVRCYDGLASNWTTLDAVVGGYRAHVANENIHITSEERSKWDTGVTQAYVLRYASVSLTALGTVAFSALDNTDNVKIGDKVLDSEGKLFALTAVDTENNAATLSALLIDLSKDSDLSNYYTKPETDTLLNDKADASALTAHTGNTTIHVTAADKEAWNGKADASALTAHTGDTTIHVTAEDKNKWDAVTSKAQDSDVMHLSGDETADGLKTFLKYITSDGSSTGDEYSPNTRTNLWLMGNRDTEEVSGILFDSYRQNTAQGTGIHILGIGIKENSVRYEGCRWGWYWDNNLNGYSFDFKPTKQGANQALTHNLGSSTDKWDTINGINPGALSLPDLDNGIDISGYISVTGGQNVLSTYTAPADGWISINLRRASGAVALMISNGSCAVTGRDTTFPDAHRECPAILPVLKNDTVTILSNLADSVLWAKFYPCQGNV